MLYRKERLDSAGSPLSGLYSLWNDWSEDEQKYTLLSVLKVSKFTTTYFCGVEYHGYLGRLCSLSLSWILIFAYYLITQNLELRGVLDLLGIRCTVGSSDLLPPPKEVLLASFLAPHHPSAKLSVGGRALSKHSHRDDTQKWWGVCTGCKYMYRYVVSTCVL